MFNTFSELNYLLSSRFCSHHHPSTRHCCLDNSTAIKLINLIKYVNFSYQQLHCSPLRYHHGTLGQTHCRDHLYIAIESKSNNTYINIHTRYPIPLPWSITLRLWQAASQMLPWQPVLVQMFHHKNCQTCSVSLPKLSSTFILISQSSKSLKA